MSESPYLPIFELTRGEIVESIHYGAVAVVDAEGLLVASYGDPDAVTYLRSSAKPFQALPFFENGGVETYHLTPREIALICASHSGTDEHVSVVQGIQAKTGVKESDLLCGTHTPSHLPTAEALRQRGKKPTPNRHNCSGKHTGMVAFARMRGQPTADYINPAHPVQQEILKTFAEMCGVTPDQVKVGIDGCSAPNFAVPLRSAALAYARLCDPRGLEAKRAQACRAITAAMTTNPDMVGGPDSFDTHLMETAFGRIVCKGGAEGYQALGVFAGARGHQSPGLGIAIKISDGDLAGHSRQAGDHRGHARPAVTLEILHQLGVISPTELIALAEYGPTFPVNNWRKIIVGQARPCFKLQLNSQQPS